MAVAWFDHLFAVLLLGVWPAVVARHGKEEIAALEGRAERRRLFRTNLVGQWAHAAALLAWWAWRGRPWAALGLGWETGPGFWLTALLLVVVVVAQLRQIARVRSDPRLRARVLAEAEHLLPLMPRGRRELRLLDALACTAGFCEELAYRGFLLWYLGAWMHPWWAVAIASLAFGAAHLYEGRSAAARVAGLALVAAVLYRLSGSLWIPMVLHAVFDVLQVRMILVAREGSPEAGELAGEPGPKAP